MTSDPLDQQLTTLARSLDLPPGDLATVTARGRARARRRHGLRGLGAAAVAGALVATVAVRDHSPEPESVTVGSAPVELDWTTVDVQTGLTGFTLGSGTTTSVGDTRFEVSTAPGDPRGRQSQLYRSGDGVDWEAVHLPEGFSARQVTGSDSQVLAVGTAPAGGAVAPEFLRSADLGATWDRVAVPLDLSAYRADRLKLQVDTLGVVGGDQTSVVVSLRASVDLEGIVPLDGSVFATWTPLGLELQEVDCNNPVPSSEDGSCPSVGDPELTPFEEIGLSSAEAELVLAGGAVVVFGEQGDGDLAEVARYLGSSGSLHVDGADASLVLGRNSGDPSTGMTAFDVYLASEGRWPEAPSYPLTEEAISWASVAGARDGQVYVLGAVAHGGGSQLYQLGATAAIPVDPFAGWRSEHPDLVIGRIAVGPLGFVAVTYRPGPEADRPTAAVLHSGDGVNAVEVALPEPPSGAIEVVSGVTVSADAVHLRLHEYAEGDLSGEGPVPQRVVVGVPAG